MICVLYPLRKEFTMERTSAILISHRTLLIAIFSLLALGNLANGQGACCLGNGLCEEFPFSYLCVEVGGEWMGEGTTCQEVECTGACCLPNETCTDDISEYYCVSEGGKYQGHGTTCSEVDCTANIPLLSDLGLLAMIIILLLSGILILRRRRPGIERR
jgi:hypothetical protein